MGWGSHPARRIIAKELKTFEPRYLSEWTAPSPKPLPRETPDNDAAHRKEEKPPANPEQLIELAVEDLGGVRGRDIELGGAMDAMCPPEGDRAGDEQVVGVVGTICSAAAVAASPVISEAGLVMISPANTSPLLTSGFAGNAQEHRHAGNYRVSNNTGEVAGLPVQGAPDRFRSSSP